MLVGMSSVKRTALAAVCLIPLYTSVQLCTCVRAAAGGQSSYTFFGLQVSAHFVPFGSLILTSVLIPRASFLGHLAGIIVGYAAAFGAFAWMTPFWTLSVALWAAIGKRRHTAVACRDDYGAWSCYSAQARRCSTQ